MQFLAYVREEVHMLIMQWEVRRLVFIPLLLLKNLIATIKASQVLGMGVNEVQVLHPELYALVKADFFAGGFFHVSNPEAVVPELFQDCLHFVFCAVV